MGKKHKLGYSEENRKHNGPYFNSLKKRVKAFYRNAGEIDWNKDYLDWCTPDMIDDLWLIWKTNVSNHQKANMLDEILEKEMGFVELGLGTNVCTFIHKKYPGVVFKIALDRCGISDNINDRWICRKVPEVNAPMVIQWEETNIISVQEYVYGIHRPEEMELYWEDALAMCEAVSKRYLCVDLTPMLKENFAIGRDMKLRTCDASDLFPLSPHQDLMRCPKVVGETKKTHKLIRCNGKVDYDKNFQWCYCEKCGEKLLPSQLRPKIEHPDPGFWIGTGLSDIEMEYACVRTRRYNYWKKEAAKRGLRTIWVAPPLMVPFPMYETVPMTEEQIARYEKKHNTKIIPYEGDEPFMPDLPPEFDDSEVDYNELRLQVGRKAIDLSPYGKFPSSDKAPDTSPNPPAKKEDVHIDTTPEDPANVESVDLEDDKPYYIDENGKMAFKSEQDQINYIRSTTTPRVFADYLYKKHLAGEYNTEQTYQLFEKYFPNSDIEMWVPISRYDDEIESVDLEDEPNDGFMRLKRREGAPELGRSSLSIKSQPSDEPNNQGGDEKKEDANNAIEFQSNPEKQTDESSMVSNSNSTMKGTEETPSESSVVAESSDQLSSAEPDEISVDEIEYENSDIDIQLSDDPKCINIAIDGYNTKSITRLFAQNGPSVYLSIDGGDSYELMITPELLGTILETALSSRDKSTN